MSGTRQNYDSMPSSVLDAATWFEPEAESIRLISSDDATQSKLDIEVI